MINMARNRLIVEAITSAGFLSLLLFTSGLTAEPNSTGVPTLAKVSNGYATATDSSFYDKWMYDESYIKALTADPDPQREADKRLVMGFEAALGRAVVEHRLEQDLDGLIDRYTTPDYHQMDPNVPDGRKGLSEWMKAGGMHKGAAAKSPPPPITLISDHDSVAMILALPPEPDPNDPSKSYPGYMISVFKVENGRISTHYSSTSRGAYWCRIDCGPEKKQ